MGDQGFWCQVLQRRISTNVSVVGRINWQRVTLKINSKALSLIAFLFWSRCAFTFMQTYFRRGRLIFHWGRVFLLLLMWIF